MPEPDGAEPGLAEPAPDEPALEEPELGEPALEEPALEEPDRPDWPDEELEPLDAPLPGRVAPEEPDVPAGGCIGELLQAASARKAASTLARLTVRCAFMDCGPVTGVDQYSAGPAGPTSGTRAIGDLRAALSSGLYLAARQPGVDLVGDSGRHLLEGHGTLGHGFKGVIHLAAPLPGDRAGVAVPDL